MSTPRSRNFDLALALIAWTGLVIQLIVMFYLPQYTGGHWLKAIADFFSYFTIQSNILVAISCSCSLRKRDAGLAYFFTRTETRTGITLYIIIVGIVYNVALRPVFHPEGWNEVANEILHVATPLLYTIGWLLFSEKRKLKWGNLVWWLIWPLLYLIYSLIRGLLINWYPYFFINAHDLPAAKVALNACMVLLAFVIIGAGLIAINRSLKPAAA